MSSELHAERATAPDLLGAYRAPANSYDELIDRSGGVRPHWRSFLGGLAALAPGERRLRSEQLNRQVRDTGIAHDNFADPTAARQPWHIDQVPLILPPAEWASIERAMIQRARLFEGILDDLYGPRELLRSGKIPPALIFSDTSYLRPCRSIATRRHLQFYAADLARDASGRWRVIDNHAETPAGLGFAVANRTVHAGVAGDLLVASKGLRLAPFFQQLQTTLQRRADGNDPRIALLTPGPQHPDYFSHAYLARYLGYLLVEGGDVRVVSDRPYLKTIEGLLPIDLIVRCVEGAVADPLELDPTGFLGPAGLVRAARRNPGLILNVLGSAVIENRGLGAYLPELCREVLDEDLQLPDAPRWWLGDAASRRRVFDSPARMVLRTAHEGTGRPGTASAGTRLSELSATERKRLGDAMELFGATRVAEEEVGFGTTPSLGADGLTPRPYAMRVFVAAVQDAYVVMPGGLAMTVDPNGAVALSAPDAHTRDVWVQTEGDVAPHVSLWRPALDTMQVRRTQHALQSRVADNQFWLGRYAERADWTMRMLRSALGHGSDDSGAPQRLEAAHATLGVLVDKDGLRPAAQFERRDAAGIESLALFLMTSADRAYGLRRTLDQLHRLASLTRDRLSLEAWRTLDVFRLGGKWPATLSLGTPQALDLLQEGLAALAAFNGLMHENMTRNHGWRLMDLGRRLERTHGLAEVLMALFAERRPANDDVGRLAWVLELADCFITYRSRYRSNLEKALVLDLLMLDESNPRSLAFQLSTIAEHLVELPRSSARSERTEEQRLILDLLTRLRLGEPAGLAASAASGNDFGELASRIVNAMPGLSDALTRRYFSLTAEIPKRMRGRREQRS